MTKKTKLILLFSLLIILIIGVIITIVTINNSHQNQHEHKYLYTSVDANSHEKTCESCDYKIIENHNFKDNICENCGYELTNHIHDLEKKNYNKCQNNIITYYECNTCHNYYLDETGLKLTALNEIIKLGNHDLILIPAKSSTCKEHGNKLSYQCQKCHLYYLDENGDNEVTYESILLPLLEHQYEMKFDDNYHYEECINCHITTEKEKHHFINNKCSCGYIKQNLDFITDYQTYEEGLYVIIDTTNITDIDVKYTKNGSTNWYNADPNLIRLVENKVRVDIIGLTKGTYSLKIKLADKEVIITDLDINNYDRSGYAHFNYKTGIGAYLDDGSLKDNTLVIYLSDNNKNNILDYAYVYDKDTNTFKKADISKYFKNNTDTSIGYFLNNRQYDDKSRYGMTAACLDYGAVNIRVLDMVNAEDKTDASKSLITGLTAYNSTEFGGSVGDNGRMARMVDAFNLTIEGIGENAGFYGFGIHFIANSNTSTKYGVSTGESFEVRNLSFANYPEDAIGMEGKQENNLITVPVSRCWIHNNVFLPGYCANPAESDKAEGDGSCDFKRGFYYTFSYNYLEDCHKTNLIGSSDSSLQYNISMHHNWWHNCASRQPLARQANIHYYNNYISVDKDYTGNIDYVISARANCYIFAENNYFDGCKQIVDNNNTNGSTKFYNNIFFACYEGLPNQVNDRSDLVTSNCNYNQTSYSNFENNAELFYLNNYYLTDPVTARQEVINNSGTHNYNALKNTQMAETLPSSYIDISNKNLIVDFSNIKANQTTNLNNIIFTNITKANQNEITGKGQIITFTLNTKTTIKINVSAKTKEQGAELIDNFGQVYLNKIIGEAEITLPSGTYILTSGIKNKEIRVSYLEFITETTKLEQTITAIKNLPNNITLSNKTQIYNAYELYNSLSENDKKQISNDLYLKLDDSFKTIQNLEVENVITLITNIGVVNENSLVLITTARDAYDLLPSNLQSLVTNYNDLLVAEETFNNLSINKIIEDITNLIDYKQIDKFNVEAIENTLQEYQNIYLKYSELDNVEIDVELVNKLENGITILESYLVSHKFISILNSLDENNISINDSLKITELKSIYQSLNSLQLSILTNEQIIKYNTILEKYDSITNNQIIISFGDESTNYKNYDFITIRGNTSTSKGELIYENISYKTCLKIETATSIVINTSSTKLYLYTDAAKDDYIKVNGEKLICQNDDGIFYIALSGEITLTKGDSFNLFLIVLQP